MSEFLPGDIDRFCFIDTETLSGADLKATGIYPYSADPAFRVMIVTYAIGDGPVQIWKQEQAHLGAWLDWNDAPDDLLAHLERVEAGEAWFVAWNAAFDRLALSRGVKGYSNARPEHFLDAMVQAVRSHLPPDLASAGRIANAEVQKRPEGKRLIQQFCVRPFAAPAEHPEAWDAFCLYALDDIPPMRTVWQATLPLSLMEWRQYWASERVNDIGMPVDVEFARAASALAEENADRANAEISRLTGGVLYSVNQHEALCAWVLDRIDHLSDAKAILLREVIEEQEEEGDGIVRLEKHSLERSRVEDLIAYLERLDGEAGLTDVEWQVYQVLQVRAYGASATPRKFTKLLPMVSEGNRLRGQYVFAGAAATGRFSSRGLQIHNLTRGTVGDQDKELAIIDAIVGGASYAQIAEHGPVGKTLSRLIRPVFVAPEGKKMIWADYSAIEARVLPWLGETFGAKPVLDIFRANDADPSLPDIYKRQAGSILGKDPKNVTKAERQSHGKVPVLSLGFGGGKGALFAMARNYGASFTEGEAGEIVGKWREVNPWARRYWDDTWEAAIWCMHNPGQPRAVGSRLTYVYLPDYMHGTLVCILPDGRPLLYPVLKWERRERRDKITGKIEVKDQLTYRRGYGRAALWYGTLVENAVQAVAGSLLRHAIWRLDDEWPQLVVGHTHDEIIAEVGLRDVVAGREAMQTAMLDLPPWAEGLPVACEASESFYYTKTID
jgi:DNA polymerase bacteriophage-type